MPPIPAAIADAPTLFLEGPAGAGKTTHAIARIQSLIEGGVSPGAILLLTPHRSYTRPYEEAIDQNTWYALGKATVGGLARRYVSLFWPAVPERELPSGSRSSLADRHNGSRGRRRIP